MLEFIKTILSRLHQAGFTDAIVAGGCLRDINHGREPKDIDIFLEDRGEEMEQMLLRHFTGWTGKCVVPAHVAQYMQFEGVSRVFEFRIPEFPPVQLVVMNHSRWDAMSLIRRHDFGICQIAHDGKNQLCTLDYQNDSLHQTFTLIRCRDKKDYDRSMKRWSRLSERYPDWRLITGPYPYPDWVTEGASLGTCMKPNRTIYEVA